MKRKLTKREGEPPSRKDSISSKIQDRISKFLVSYLVKTPVTPNQITIFRFTILVPLSALFFSIGTYFFNIIGVFLYIFNNILDYVDGDLARAKNMSSSLGDLIEHLADVLCDNLIVLGIGIGAYAVMDNALIVLITAVLSIVTINLVKIFSIHLDLDHQGKVIPARILNKSTKIDKLMLAIVCPEKQILKVVLFPSYLITITTFLNFTYVSLYLIPTLCSVRAIAMFYTLYRKTQYPTIRDDNI